MKKKWLPLWVVPLTILMATGTVWLRLSMIRTTYAIDQADQAIRNLQMEQEKLNLKVTGLRSPRRLETLAKTKFSLQRPRSDQVIHLGR